MRLFLNRKSNCSKALVLSTAYSDSKQNSFFFNFNKKPPEVFGQGYTIVTIPFYDIFILHIYCHYYSNVRIRKHISRNVYGK